MNGIKYKILFLFFITQYLFAQISPGDLSNAHKNLEGMSNCTQCHVLGDNVDNKKCLDCHTEVNELIKSNHGFHSSSDVKGKECSECHGEHFGRDFDVIRFDEDKFDHSKTKFELTGKHSETKCEECHKTEFIKIKKLKERKKTFLGLETSCVSCHSDFHQGTLSSDNCVDCHNTEAWRPAPNFLHNNSKFKLVGAHKKVDCEKCHKKEIRNNEEFQKFTGLKFSNCVSCHTDIHKGKFGTNCAECHTNISFKNVKNLKSFDHSKTRFQLIGKHKALTCNECHTKGIRVKLHFENCVDCHSDFHKGELASDEGTTDCKACHDEHGFAPSKFTIEEHNKNNFKLTGGHFAVPCNECHFVDENWKFKFSKTDCETCHDNVHKETLKFGTAVVEDCETCHTTTAWSSVSFEHSKTEFELIGKHADVSCSKCHFKDEKLPHQFVSLTQNCESCHTDNHNGQFEEKYKNNCSDCHSPIEWAIETFDHSTTRFTIDGAHENVNCNECHKEIEIDVNKFVQYKFEDVSCKSCHT